REPLAAEEGAEEVAEAERAVGTPAGGGAAVAEHVVAPPLLRVAQHLVGRPDLLEALLGLRVVAVAVGVVAARQLAVRAPDLVVGRVAFDPEDLVVVTAHGAPTRHPVTRGAARAGVTPLRPPTA